MNNLLLRVLLGLFLTTAVGFSQTAFGLARQRWLTLDGALLDGGANGASRLFARLENGKASASEITAYVNDLMGDESWSGGNRGAGLIALQLCLWEKSKLPASDYQRLWSRLLDLGGDDYYWGIGWSNTGINCVTVHYVMMQFLPTGASVRYGDVPDVYGPQDFSYSGRMYKRGQRYSVKQLCEDWLYNWMERYAVGADVHGELFSETYSYHFLACLVTLADARSVQDGEMHRRAAMTADLFLLEHGANANGHHLAGPLGRTYMISHISGDYFFFPFDTYFGRPYPTRYGHPGAFYVSSYRVAAGIENIVASLPRGLTSSVQGGRYVVATDRYTLGSEPNGGGWLLEINSNDPGPAPQARPGFDFRLWVNNVVGDLDPNTCSGECYSEMGQAAHQYRYSMLISTPDPKLYETPWVKWDRVENQSGWRFTEENGVAVAILLRSDGAAVEVSYLGQDNSTFESFKSAVLAKSNLVSTNEFVTRLGDRIENRGGRTFVNGQLFNQNLPRLEVVNAAGQKVVRTLASGLFDVGGVQYDFGAWSRGGPIVDRVPPIAPSRVRIE